MKTRDIKALATKTDSELRTQLGEILAELTGARLEHAQRKLTNTTNLTMLRHQIARIQTVLNDPHRTAPVEETKNVKKITKSTDSKVKTDKGGKK